MANQYTKSEIDTFIVSEYANGNGSLSFLAKKYNISRKILTRWVNESNIKIERLNNRTLHYDEFIFDEIDTEEKAYWLGFIAADGYVSDSNNFELSLSLKDLAHLEKFGKFINVIIKTDHFRCRVGVKNKHLKKTLEQYGIIPRKSLILKFPQNIKKDLINHYIRGYFDGDGSIYLGVKNKDPERIMANASVRFLGTLDFLQNVQKHLNAKSSITKRHNQNIYQLEIKTARAMILATDYMYKNANIYLERKQNKYCRLKQKCLRVLASKYGGRCDS